MDSIMECFDTGVTEVKEEKPKTKLDFRLEQMHGGKLMLQLISSFSICVQLQFVTQSISLS